MDPLSNYLSYMGSFQDAFAVLLLLLLGMARLTPIVVMAPYYGAKVLPGPIKVGLVLSLAIVFLPQLSHLTKSPLQFDLVYLTLIFKELFIGFILGFFASLPFNIAGASGSLIDFQRGASSLLVAAPAMGEQVSPIGLLYNYVMIVIFYKVGGVALFLDSVSHSYLIIPPDQMINSAFFSNLNLPMWQTLLGVLNDVVRIATQLAAPALITMFMSDMFLGIANRLATQVPMSFLGWALKSVGAVAVLWVGWSYLVAQLEVHSLDWIHMLDKLMPSFVTAP